MRGGFFVCHTSYMTRRHHRSHHEFVQFATSTIVLVVTTNAQELVCPHLRGPDRQARGPIDGPLTRCVTKKGRHIDSMIDAQTAWRALTTSFNGVERQSKHQDHCVVHQLHPSCISSRLSTRWCPRGGQCVAINGQSMQSLSQASGK